MPWKHGTIYGYVRQLCRCDACSKEMRAYRKQGHYGRIEKPAREPWLSVDDRIDEIARVLWG